MYRIPLGTRGIACAIYPLHSMHVLKGQTILMTMTTVLALKTVIEPKTVAQGYVILVWDLSHMVIHKRKVHLRKETFPSFTGTEEGESNGWDSPGTEEDGNHDWDSRGTEEGEAMARLRLTWYRAGWERWPGWDLEVECTNCNLE